MTTQEKPKSNTVVTTRMVHETNQLVFVVAGVGELWLNINDMSMENRQRAVVHGLEQRVRDAAAIPFAANKRYPTPQDKYDAMKKLVEHYNSGTTEWAITRTLERKVDYTSGLLELALFRMHKGTKTKEYIRDWLKQRTPAQRMALLNDPTVKPIADAIQEEQRSVDESVDTEELLAGL